MTILQNEIQDLFLSFELSTLGSERVKGRIKQEESRRELRQGERWIRNALSNELRIRESLHHLPVKTCQTSCENSLI